MDWKGKVPHDKNTDPRFEQFTTMVWGLRAMILDVVGDIVTKKQNTIRKLITKYAPANENDTNAYINGVARQIGLLPDAIIEVKQPIIQKLILAMVKIENGSTLPVATFNEAWLLTPYAERDKKKRVVNKFNVGILLGLGVTAGASFIIFKQLTKNS